MTIGPGVSDRMTQLLVQTHSAEEMAYRTTSLPRQPSCDPFQVVKAG